MSSNKNLSSEIVGFVTKRLFDLTRAYQTNCEATLELTDVPQQLLEAISWMKFDRHGCLANEYVRRKEIHELIRVDANMIRTLVKEVAAIDPYSVPIHSQNICPIKQPHRAYQAQIHDCMTVFIATIVTDMRSGRNLESRSVTVQMGFDSETVWSLAALHSEQTYRVAQLYAERVSFNDFYLIDMALLSNLVDQAMETAKGEEKLEKFILLGATQTNIKELIGPHIKRSQIRNTMIAERKKFLDYVDRREQMIKVSNSSMGGKQRDHIYDLWLQNLNLPIVDRYIVVAQETRIRISVIASIIKSIEPDAETRCA